MKVKRYIAKTAQEALQKIKDELGQEAVILNTRRIYKRGIKRWFSKPLIEVVAAIDDLNEINNNLNTRNESYRQPSKSESKSINNIGPKETTFENLENKITNVENLVQKLFNGTYNHTIDVSAPFSAVYNQLVKNEVHENIAKAIIAEAEKLQLKKAIEISDCVDTVLLNYLGYPRPLTSVKGRKKVILFLGPTGVGKTTTLAKLAAFFSIKQQREVGLITADTYRIAAIDQLKIYAEILGIPLTVVYSPKEAGTAIENFKDKEVILIDTAGKSLKDKEQEREITDLISYSQPDEIYLVINSNTGYQACRNIIDKYKFLKDYKLIFTKIDEVDTHGIILNCCFLTGKPLSYVTTGQNVPDDIEIADPKRIVAQLIGRECL